MSNQPDWGSILQQWWGGEYNCFSASAIPSVATNLFLSTGNPPYQISDFLAFYPKFGTGAQGVLSASQVVGGTGYTAGDQLALVQPDATGCIIGVLTVNGTGVILTFTVLAAGTGYSVASNLPVTGGTGSGATFTVTSVSPTTLVVPTVVMQTYINLATASLSSIKWGEIWHIAMGLYVAHFLTLYLRSEGNAGVTPNAIAKSGLEAGIAVSSSAGDVSKSIQLAPGLEAFAAWGQTTYGTQLATFAKVVGMGPMYIRGL